MTNLQTLNGCTCLVQYVHLSCPFVNLTCKNCEFNPLSWSQIFISSFVTNALNTTREIPFVKVPDLEI